MPRERKSLKSTPEGLDVQDTLEALVKQFADPLSFFRELVQNAVDAGTTLVDIRIEFQKDRGKRGVLIIHVDDWGEGMDREIIDHRLTRLFSSAKDGDYTKIGRFGIGFVSIFAIEPEAVCLDTSRGGENWRVLFKPDRSFTRLALDTPVEGTKIQLIKTVSQDQFESFVEDSRRVVAFWCKHLAVEVRFQGEKINQPFEVEALCQERHQQEGCEVLAGYTADGSSFAGYYNRGLTLLEESPGPIEGVAFKINSRYLEHTLTRDNVIRDANFDKVMGILKWLLQGPLPERLLGLLEAKVKSGESGKALDDLYLAAARCLPKDLNALFGFSHLPDYSPLRFVMDKKLGSDRILFRDVEGRRLTLKECLRAGGAGTDAGGEHASSLFFDEPDSPVGAALQDYGALVVAAAPQSAARLALETLTGAPVVNASVHFFLLEPVAPEGAALEVLRRALFSLLKRSGSRILGVEYARFSYPGSCISDLVAVTSPEARGPYPREEAKSLHRSWFGSKRRLWVNLDHPAVVRLASLAKVEPELSAYLLAKRFFLQGKLTTARDSRLAVHALEARCPEPTA